MKTKTSAYYQRLYRQRLREQGLVKKEVWILPRHAQALSEIEHALREEETDGSLNIKENKEMSVSQIWTVPALQTALSAHGLFTSGRASQELLQGAEESLLITMHEFGDLPLFLVVSGDQILVEAVLWPVSDVNVPEKFNEEVLRTHKLFPLSSIALETMPDGRASYIMFGALSAASSLLNVVEEIEVLADNVIKATEAYSMYLKDTVLA